MTKLSLTSHDRILINTRLTLKQSVTWLPVIPHYRVVVVLAVIAQPDRNFVSSFILFMKSPHWFTGIGVYLDWAVVNLWESLQFDVITPLVDLNLTISVFCYIFISNESAEKFFVWQNILHAFLPHYQVIIAFSINLVRNRSEKTVAVWGHFHNLHLLLQCELTPKICFFFLPINQDILSITIIFLLLSAIS